ARHPDIRFTATAVAGGVVSGLLSLNGAARPVRLPFSVRDGVATAELRVDQRDWGIKPFRALMGALKVQPVVRIEVSVPWR
ncbi:MAG: YceI family protein, partial [Myxococcales bacterium]|nr:YceI family protein [Myxococcales bacterium]